MVNNPQERSRPQERGRRPPSQCRFCPMTFKKLEHAQRHERTHTLDRPYPCIVCGKAFARQDTLNRHARLHTRTDEELGTKGRRRRVKSDAGANLPPSKQISGNPPATGRRASTGTVSGPPNVSKSFEVGVRESPSTFNTLDPVGVPGGPGFGAVPARRFSDVGYGTRPALYINTAGQHDIPGASLNGFSDTDGGMYRSASDDFPHDNPYDVFRVPLTSANSLHLVNLPYPFAAQSPDPLSAVGTPPRLDGTHPLMVPCASSHFPSLSLDAMNWANSDSSEYGDVDSNGGPPGIASPMSASAFSDGASLRSCPSQISTAATDISGSPYQQQQPPIKAEECHTGELLSLLRAGQPLTDLLTSPDQAQSWPETQPSPPNQILSQTSDFQTFPSLSVLSSVNGLGLVGLESADKPETEANLGSPSETKPKPGSSPMIPLATIAEEPQNQASDTVHSQAEELKESVSDSRASSPLSDVPSE